MKGRKRQICVEVLGLVLSCDVGAANQADVEAAPAVLVPALFTYTSIEKILANQGDRGNLVEERGSSFWVSTGTHKEAPRRVRSSTLALDSRAHIKLG